MELHVSNSSEAVTVADAVLGAEFNEPLVHQVVTAYLAGGRAGTKAQKTRSDVSGGGKKPWRQKGTGRARAGTNRSPLWRGGGTTFAARPRSYEQKVNRKMWRGAMRAILSELVRQQRLEVTGGISVSEPKTKRLLEQLGSSAEGRILIVTEEVERNLYLAARNLAHVALCDSSALDPVMLVNADKVVVTVDALKRIEGLLQ